MKIEEINNRINELEISIEALQSIKQEFIESNKGEIAIKALSDGICYTAQRLEEYKRADWIMAIE